MRKMKAQSNPNMQYDAEGDSLSAMTQEHVSNAVGHLLAAQHCGPAARASAQSATGSHIDPERQVQAYKMAASDEFSVRIRRNWTSVGRETQLSSGIQALRGIQEA